MRKQRKERGMPGVEVEELQKILEGCRMGGRVQSQGNHLESEEAPEVEGGGVAASNGVSCENGSTDHCAACDGTFFPLLLKETKDVVCWFDERAQKLLRLRFHSGFRKYAFWAKGNIHNQNENIIQRCRDLMNYAIVKSTEMRKMLKKYDKIHDSNKGQAFHSQMQTMHLEILQSPWLCELMALYINAQKSCNSWAPSNFDVCSLTFKDGKPLLSCGLFDSLKLSIDLTCSICLDIVFDIVSLSCGHIFCYMCACNAASVSIVDGLKSADPKSKCPLCRQAGVYKGSVRLNELNILLSQSCNEYWKQRLRRERMERVQKAKEHWQLQCQTFMGF